MQNDRDFYEFIDPDSYDRSAFMADYGHLFQNQKQQRPSSDTNNCSFSSKPFTLKKLGIILAIIGCFALLPAIVLIIAIMVAV